jgi:hypothetical protein
MISDAGWDGRAWVGYGAGSYRWIAPPYQAEQKELHKNGRFFYRADYAHNDWLEMLATWGVIGMLPVLAMLGWLGLPLIRAFHEGHPETVPLALGLILLGAHASLDLLFWFTPLMFTAVFIAAAMTCLTLIATMTGDADDLLFILYFETFPEHWHGETAPLTLLGRVPHFAGLLAAYTGGGVVLLLALCLWGAPSAARRAAQGLGLGALAYASLLATIDHHPTHYFLPLGAQALDSQGHDVALFQEAGRLHAHADAGRRAGGDDVPRVQSHEFAHVAHQLGGAKDHCSAVAGLHPLAV